MRNFKKHLSTSETSGLRVTKPKYELPRPILALCSLLFLSTVATAQEDEQDWWFNVEVIVFKRDLLPTNTEEFSKMSYGDAQVHSNQILILSTIQQQGLQEHYLKQLPMCENVDIDYNIPIQFSLGDIPAMVTNEWWRITYPIELTVNTSPLTSPDESMIQQQQDEMDGLITSLQQNRQITPQDQGESEELNDGLSALESQTNAVKQSNVLSSTIIQSLEYQQRIALIRKSIKKRETESLNNYLSELVDFSVQPDSMDLTIKKGLDTATTRYSQALYAQMSDEHKMQRAQTALHSAVESLKNLMNEYNENLGQLITLDCRKRPLWTRHPTHIQESLFAIQPHFKRHIHLVDQSSLALTEYAKQIFRQRDIQPLLYASWRDNIVFGIENAPYVRLVAGELLTTERFDEMQTYEEWLEQYTINEALKGISNLGETLSEVDIEAQSDFFEELEKAIEENKPVDWLALENSAEQDTSDINSFKQHFEVDGLFKVYLEYVNQVPYLHIDSELNHATLELDSNGKSLLKVYPFKQRRRIISKQIHYFDHPAFGMIVRLERFVPPDPINSDTQETVTTNN